MALIENMIRMDGTIGPVNKVQVAIQRLKAFEPLEGYYLAFSGGKDSVVIERLARMAGVSFEAHRSNTTCDPPELIYFTREHYPELIVEQPMTTMWELIPKKLMPPTRVVRYCCDELKECFGKGRLMVFGVRAGESTNRAANHGLITAYSKTKAKRHKYFIDNPETIELVSTCYTKQKHSLNPIVDWSEEDVWEFIHVEKIPYCGLYDEGFKRLGCVGCPMARDGRKEEFKRWPKIEEAYIKSFERMVQERIKRGKNEGKTFFTSGESVMTWWLDDRNMDKQIEGQIEMEWEAT